MKKWKLKRLVIESHKASSKLHWDALTAMSNPKFSIFLLIHIFAFTALWYDIFSFVLCLIQTSTWSKTPPVEENLPSFLPLSWDKVWGEKYLLFSSPQW